MFTERTKNATGPDCFRNTLLKELLQLNGQTPYERYLALEKQILIQTDITEKYWKKQETIRPRNYQYLRLAKKINMSQMS